MFTKVEHEVTPQAFQSALRYSDSCRNRGADETLEALRNAYTMLVHFVPKKHRNGSETLTHIIMRIRELEGAEARAA